MISKFTRDYFQLVETDNRIINYEVGQKGLKGNIFMNIEFPSVAFQYKFISQRKFSKELKISLILISKFTRGFFQLIETDSRIINYEVGQKGLKGNIAMNIRIS